MCAQRGTCSPIPFQRSRYDERIGHRVHERRSGVEVATSRSSTTTSRPKRPRSQLTGWRKFMAPPPPKKPAAATGAGNGKQPPPARPVKRADDPDPGRDAASPTPRSRGMALLFDFAVVLVIYWVVLLVVPGVDQQRVLRTRSTQINHLNSLHDAQSSIDDAKSSLATPTRRSRSQHATAETARRAVRQGVGPERPEVGAVRLQQGRQGRRKEDVRDRPPRRHRTTPTRSRSRPTSSATTSVARSTSRTSSCSCSRCSTSCPRPRSPDARSGCAGARSASCASTARRSGGTARSRASSIPIVVALAIPTIGPLLGLGIVLWGYRDPNGQGIHDKLARTLVVANRPIARRNEVGENRCVTCTRSRRARRSRSSCSAARAPTSPR